MIGLLIVAHSGLAAALLAAAEMVVGEIPCAAAVGIEPADDAGQIHRHIEEALRHVAADGAIILTDMFGGTPSNVGLSFLQEGKVEVVTGVNLPMLLEFFSKRDRLSVPELAKAAEQCGKTGITVAGDFLKR